MDGDDGQAVRLVRSDQLTAGVDEPVHVRAADLDQLVDLIGLRRGADDIDRERAEARLTAQRGDRVRAIAAWPEDGNEAGSEVACARDTVGCRELIVWQ